jgi:two-component system CheB/CheR fusion protein
MFKRILNYCSYSLLALFIVFVPEHYIFQIFALFCLFILIFNIQTDTKAIEIEQDKIVELKNKLTKVQDDRNKYINSQLALTNILSDLQTSEKSLKEKSQSLVDKNNELESFSYIISHDLKAPVRHIGAFTDRLVKKLGDVEDQKTNRYIEALKNASSQMNILIDEVYSYSKACQFDDFELIDLNILTDEIKNNLLNDQRFTDIEINVEKLPKLKVNKVAISQVFQNLVENALKYNQSTIKKLTINSSEDNSGCYINFIDNGIGIDSNDYEYIFKIFKRLHTNGEYEGTGAGLTICKKIMEKHGGSIYVKSKPGAGSCFTLFFPARIT